MDLNKIYTYPYTGLLFVILFTLFLMPISQVGAEGTLSTFKKPIPKVPDMDHEEFIKLTKPISKTPNNSDYLAYSMRVPKEWTEREDYSSPNFILSGKLFLDLNVFYGPPSFMGRSRIEVQAINLDSALTVEQWYLKYIIEGGLSLEGFEVHKPDKVEALRIVMEGDSPFYLRTLAMLNGDKIILLKYYVPVAHIQESAGIQKKVLDSFELKNEFPRVYPEMKAYRFLDVAEIPYPQTWKAVGQETGSVDQMSAVILNLGDRGQLKERNQTTLARVNVSVVTTSVQASLIEQIKNFKKEVEAEGLLVGKKMTEDYNFKYNPDMEFALTEVYEGVDSTSNLSEYEVWFTVFVGGYYYYFTLMITPSRDDSYGVWAENIQNYKLMVKNFKPLAGAFIERD